MATSSNIDICNIVYKHVLNIIIVSSNLTCLQSITFVDGSIRQMLVPILLYGWELFCVVKTESTFKYDVAHWTHKLHISEKLHGII